MNKIILIILFFMTTVPMRQAAGQAAELEQLVLDIEKLAQLKKILDDMKAGFNIVSKGYGTIRNVSQGNFNLHEAFLDGLYVVNPRLRKYRKVADIIRYQSDLLKEYKSAFQEFKSSGVFTPGEIAYLGNVYTNLFDRSLQNLDELTLVLTDSKLRMSDDERLSAIDRIYKEMKEKLGFLRNFNRQARALGQQRKRMHRNASELERLYNLKN